MKTTILLLVSSLAMASAIIGGREARVGDVPTMAAFIVTFPQGNYFCGGSIISATSIISAAQCFDEATGAQCVVGITNIREFEPSAQRQQINRSNWKIHEQWDPSKGLNDIAIVRLDTPLTLNQYVLPISLPRRSDVSRQFDSETGIAAGWGITRDGESELSDILRWMDNDIESNQYCAEFFPGLITANHICSSGNNKRSVCDGDNGGPLIINDDGDFKMVGIASFVYETCETDAPAAFTRLTSYLDWIQSNSDVVIRP